MARTKPNKEIADMLSEIIDGHPGVSKLLSEKQDWLVSEGHCLESDLIKLGSWHQISAELVIIDLLKKLEKKPLVLVDINQMVERVEMSFFMIFMQTRGYWPYMDPIGEPPRRAEAKEMLDLCSDWVEYNRKQRKLMAGPQSLPQRTGVKDE